MDTPFQKNLPEGPKNALQGSFGALQPSRCADQPALHEAAIEVDVAPLLAISQPQER